MTVDSYNSNKTIKSLTAFKQGRPISIKIINIRYIIASKSIFKTLPMSHTLNAMPSSTRFICENPMKFSFKFEKQGLLQPS